MRRLFLAIAAILTLGAGAAAAEQAGRAARVGILSPAASESNARFDAFRAGLGALGHVEGRSIVLEFRLAHGGYDRLPALAVELVRSCDLIVAESTQAARAAREASGTIPIAAVVNSDPVASGLAESLARPGGNVTGVAVLAGELTRKRLDLLREAIPAAQRVAALLRPPGEQVQEALKQAGKELGLAVETVGVGGPDALRQALGSTVLDEVDGVLVPPQSLFWVHRREIVAAVAAKRRPAIYPDRDFVDEGGLMSYGPSAADAFRRLASYVDRLLKGARPADLPIEQPTTFELAVNMKTARALGLTIPPSILLRADEVIE